MKQAPTSANVSRPAQDAIAYPIAYYSGFGENRPGSRSFLIQLEDLDGVVPKNQPTLFFRQVGIVENLQPKLVQSGRHANPSPCCGPVSAEHNPMRSEFVDCETQMLRVRANHIEVDIDVTHCDCHRAVEVSPDAASHLS